MNCENTTCFAFVLPFEISSMEVENYKYNYYRKRFIKNTYIQILLEAVINHRGADHKTEETNYIIYMCTNECMNA